jgi:malate dehydrogenase (oxaloacetate-decarboxylating)
MRKDGWKVRNNFIRKKMQISPIYQESLQVHLKHQGKLGVKTLTQIKDAHDLALLYTPGVAEPCRVIAEDKKKSFDLTMRGRTVAVISDGSAVLGLGNIGPEASLPVMEGKALLMKEFGGVDAIPLAINTQKPEEIITFVRQIAPSFAGINLEDITAPGCFTIEEALQDLGIPVFHDDQHGTAIVVTAALMNATKVVGKKYRDLKVVLVGSGAAGLATARMLLGMECSSQGCSLVAGSRSIGDLIVVDSKGALSKNRTDLNIYKQVIAQVSNKMNLEGSLQEVIKGADVVIGVSRAGLITQEMVASMAPKAIVFAMANPEPEIMPDLAKKAGAMVVATGRSDFANQINNVLVFPAIFKAVIDGRLERVTSEMKLKAAEALAELVPEPTADRIIPEPFFPDLAKKISEKLLKN